jgi:hypothetical protein
MSADGFLARPAYDLWDGQRSRFITDIVHILDRELAPGQEIAVVRDVTERSAQELADLPGLRLGGKKLNEIRRVLGSHGLHLRDEEIWVPDEASGPSEPDPAEVEAILTDMEGAPDRPDHYLVAIAWHLARLGYRKGSR